MNRHTRLTLMPIFVDGRECFLFIPGLGPTNTGTRSPSRPVASPAVNPPAAGEVSGEES